MFIYSIDIPSKYTHSAIDLLDTVFESFISDTSIVDLVFLGDSVSTQLSQFLICDLLRLKIPTSTPLFTTVESFNHTTTEFHFTSSIINNYLQNRTKHEINKKFFKSKQHTQQEQSSDKIKSLRIHNKQFNIPCVNIYGSNECLEILQTSHGKNQIIHHTTHYIYKLLQHFLNTTNLDLNLINKVSSIKVSSGWNRIGLEEKEKRREVYIIMNYGLHLKKIHRPWAIEGIIKGLYQQQMRLLKQSIYQNIPIKSYLLWREISTQSFGYSDGN